MTTIDRPNIDALRRAIDIYRDCMRKFLLHHLKRIQGRTVDQAVADVLPPSEVNNLVDHQKLGKAIEDFIDVNHFPRLIRDYWHPVFSRVWPSSPPVHSQCEYIRVVRNEAYHPGTQDIGTAQTVTCLQHIVEVLDLINCPDERATVAQLLDSRYATEASDLLFEMGELWFQVTEMREEIDRLGYSPDRDRPAIEHRTEPIGKDLTGKAVSGAKDTIATEEQDIGSEHDSQSEPMPKIGPGALYYCAQEGCDFTGGEFAGTRRAWWRQAKANRHAKFTGHIVKVVPEQPG